MSAYFFTSESVSEGHPDKIADQISDGILDAILAADPEARVACETLVKTGLVVLAGEVSTSAYVDFAATARQVIKNIGYDDPEIGFDYRSCGILTSIDEQSPDIAQGVDSDQAFSKDSGEIGAGDQGMMFGYACDETAELMPATIYFAHKVLENLAAARKSKAVSFLRPDAKSQITASYENGKFDKIQDIVLSTQHHPDVSYDTLKEFVIEECIKKTIPAELLAKEVRFYINPTGKFVVGGPQGDCGLTGRKIIVDTYGGHGAHGGGAFSGKDPTKVDRSAAYMSRYIAKHLVRSGMAQKCLVQLSYAIGVAHPISVFVETYGTSKMSYQDLSAYVRETFPLTPKGIIEHLQLKQPIYQKTASYGHFGHPEYSWEKPLKGSSKIS